MPLVVLLGPQRYRPTLAATLASVGAGERAAVVTAGWQEREGELDELEEHVGHEVIRLALYERHDDVLSHDAELAAALRERQERLRRLQELYRLRLEHALAAARALMERPGRGGLLDEHRRSSIRALRTLDRQHVQRIRKLWAEFDAQWHPAERPAIAGHRAELRQLLREASCVVIAGGNVGVLAGRMRLFDLLSLAGELPLVAWSAGAMALAERIVLFHDSPPQGRGNPEVLEPGLAACPGLVPLPHARRRLRLGDPVRVSLFARRFAPATCAVLETGSRLDWNGDGWRAAAGTVALGRRGGVEPLPAA